MLPAIKTENLSKAYQIGEFSTGTISRDIERWWFRLRGKEDPFLRIGESEASGRKEINIVWSLKDVNFEINHGDAVGIIGRNGAGKSTLLKILSRVTTPTVGSVKLKGRIASLLEVGTGFHPELTGRENIFLNGAILGMRKQEIKRKFDEIVDFSGVERYIDTPVKRYSSGMYVRLAFAVAAHLDSEILVVDEVLAVGDGEFQNKCLGKMDQVSKGEGRTVLFVSHNMGSISQLCNSAILLNKGKLVTSGPVKEVVDYYINDKGSNKEILRIDKTEINEENQFVKVFMADRSDNFKAEYGFDEDIFVKVELYLPKFYGPLELAMRLIDRNKRAVFTIHEGLKQYTDGNPYVNLTVHIPGNFVTPGQYSWVMCINHPGVGFADLQDDVLPFLILETGSPFARYDSIDYGSVYARYDIEKSL
jgi:lipopolysaccharide transport system ATP-binding protein